MNIKLLIAGILVFVAAILFPILVTNVQNSTIVTYTDYAACFIGTILIFASLFGRR